MKHAERVLDSYSILAHLKNEPGSELMDDVYGSAAKSGHQLLLTTVNWGEVYYTTLRTYGQQWADRVVQLVARLPIRLIPADRELAFQAAQYKAFKKMSYSDCFAAALAKLHRAELVTGDKEFKAVEDEVKILWL